MAIWVVSGGSVKYWAGSTVMSKRKPLRRKSENGRAFAGGSGLLMYPRTVERSKRNGFAPQRFGGGKLTMWWANSGRSPRRVRS